MKKILESILFALIVTALVVVGFILIVAPFIISIGFDNPLFMTMYIFYFFVWVAVDYYRNY